MEQVKESSTNKKPSRIKKAAKFLFDFPAWIGVDNITGYSQWIGRSFKICFSAFSQAKRAPAEETFEEAMARQALTKEDLQKQFKTYMVSSWVFFLLAIGSCIYLASLWQRGSWLVDLAMIFVVLILTVKSYFYSFWCLQIRRQKLGCTFNEWLTWIFKGKV